MVHRKWSLEPRFRGGSLRQAAVILFIAPMFPVPPAASPIAHEPGSHAFAATPTSPVDNFTASINRLVDLVALAGSGILALVWARVALSWFSNDITKKIQAKDRARDALIGTLLFMAAVTGLLYGLAHWVLTGS